MLVTFLPAMMLSGFLFDLRSMPAVDPRDQLSFCRPAIMSACCRPIFLAGNVWGVILFNATVLAGMAGCWCCLTGRRGRNWISRW